jgi:D-amino-acid dehydrogenase
VRSKALALRTLLHRAPLLHQALANRAGVPHLIELRGVLHVFPTRNHFTAEAPAWEIRREAGISWTELNADQLRLREPGLHRRYGFAISVDEAGTCRNPGAYVAALAAEAMSAGARWIRAKASGIEVRGGRLRHVQLDDGSTVACDMAVITAGVRSGQLAAKAGDVVPLAAERGYHACIDLPEAGPFTSLSASDCKVVVNRMEHGLRVAGQVEIAPIDAAPDWRRARILGDHLLSMFPDLPKNLPASQVRYWLGSRPSLPDGLPCIGRSSKTADVIYAFGHGHIGLVAAARTARLVAQLISMQTPEIDLAPFDPRRFSGTRRA